MALCAVCDETHATSRLCESCRLDPANDDWIEGDESPLEEHDVTDTDRRIFATMSEALDRRLLEMTPLAKRICALLIDGREVFETYRDPRRFRPVTRKRKVPVTPYEVAQILGCSHTYVYTVLSRVLNF